MTKVLALERTQSQRQVITTIEILHVPVAISASTSPLFSGPTVIFK